MVTVWPQPQPDSSGQIIKARTQKLLHCIVWLSSEQSSVCGVRQGRSFLDQIKNCQENYILDPGSIANSLNYPENRKH